MDTHFIFHTFIDASIGSPELQVFLCARPEHIESNLLCPPADLQYTCTAIKITLVCMHPWPKHWLWNVQICQQHQSELHLIPKDPASQLGAPPAHHWSFHQLHVSQNCHICLHAGHKLLLGTRLLCTALHLPSPRVKVVEKQKKLKLFLLSYDSWKRMQALGG